MEQYNFDKKSATVLESEGELILTENLNNDQFQDTHVKVIADISTMLVDGEQYEDFQKFLQTFSSTKIKRLLANEQFLAVFLNFKMHMEKYDDVIEILEGVENATTPILLQIWDEAHYRKYQTEWSSQLTPVQRFRIRKRNPPPTGICPRGERPTTKMSELAITILKKWFQHHINDPYPSKNKKIELSQRAGVTIQQVNTWFANARRKRNKQISEDQKEKNVEQNSRAEGRDEEWDSEATEDGVEEMTVYVHNKSGTRPKLGNATETCRAEGEMSEGYQMILKTCRSVDKTAESKEVENCSITQSKLVNVNEQSYNIPETVHTATVRKPVQSEIRKQNMNIHNFRPILRNCPSTVTTPIERKTNHSAQTERKVNQSAEREIKHRVPFKCRQSLCNIQGLMKSDAVDDHANNQLGNNEENGRAYRSRRSESYDMKQNRTMIHDTTDNARKLKTEFKANGEVRFSSKSCLSKSVWKLRLKLKEKQQRDKTSHSVDISNGEMDTRTCLESLKQLCDRVEEVTKSPIDFACTVEIKARDDDEDDGTDDCVQRLDMEGEETDSCDETLDVHMESSINSGGSQFEKPLNSTDEYSSRPAAQLQQTECSKINQLDDRVKSPPWTNIVNNRSESTNRYHMTSYEPIRPEETAGVCTPINPYWRFWAEPQLAVEAECVPPHTIVVEEDGRVMDGRQFYSQGESISAFPVGEARLGTEHVGQADTVYHDESPVPYDNYGCPRATTNQTTSYSAQGPVWSALSALCFYSSTACPNYGCCNSHEVNQCSNQGDGYRREQTFYGGSSHEFEYHGNCQHDDTDNQHAYRLQTSSHQSYYGTVVGEAIQGLLNLSSQESDNNS